MTVRMRIEKRSDDRSDGEIMGCNVYKYAQCLDPEYFEKWSDDKSDEL